LFGLSFHKQTKELFSDLLQLHSKFFEPLQGLLNSIVGCFHQYPFSLGYFLPSLIQKLEDKDVSESDIKAVTAILSNEYITHRIVKKWKNLELFVRCLTHAQVQEKATIQSKLYSLFTKFLQSYFSEPICTTLPDMNHILPGVPSDSVKKAIETITYQNNLNSNAYRRIMTYLCELLESSTVHWRYQTIALGFLLILRQQHESEQISVGLLNTLFKILEKVELPILRTLSYLF